MGPAAHSMHAIIPPSTLGGEGRFLWACVERKKNDGRGEGGEGGGGDGEAGAGDTKGK